MSIGIDPEQLIARLAQRVGELTAQLDVRDLALEAAEKRIAELEGSGNADPEG